MSLHFFKCFFVTCFRCFFLGGGGGGGGGGQGYGAIDISYSVRSRVLYM